MIIVWLWASALAVPVLSRLSFAPYTIAFLVSAIWYLIAEMRRFDQVAGRLIVVSSPFLWVLAASLLRLQSRVGLVLVLTLLAGLLATCVGALGALRTDPERLVRSATAMLLVLVGLGTLELLFVEDPVFKSRYTAGLVAIVGAYVLSSGRASLSAFRLLAGTAALMSVAVTGARMASLVLLLSMVVAVLRSIRRNSIAPAILAAALMAVAASGAIGEVIRDRFSTGWEGDSYSYGSLRVYTSGRAATWQLVWSDVWESPIFGHGAGRSSAVVDAASIGLGHPLNDYLRVADDLGLLGAGALALILIWLVRQLRQPGADPIGGLAIMIACLILAITENILIYSLWLIPAGLLMGYSIHRADPNPLERAALTPMHQSRVEPNQPTRGMGSTAQSNAASLECTRGQHSAWKFDVR